MFNTHDIKEVKFWLPLIGSRVIFCGRIEVLGEWVVADWEREGPK